METISSPFPTALETPSRPSSTTKVVPLTR
ncbi:hypothetical protein CMUS01_00839 [Colletotrichum musicola]|uniref:Uncharacterized protein n=1 Tax=Colletotrichum musicola TaxID=2175873 RepID=A0A8H6NY98_9PEZI|nr:hypothetical protein CMUS01_00839 [Colletotrichum musicola]